MSKKRIEYTVALIRVCFTVSFPFPLRGYSTIEAMRKCQHHDLTAFILENKVKEKDKGKKRKTEDNAFTKIHHKKHLIITFTPE